ncbi:putative ubiquitin carboxyl-terminal hydrolase 43 [Apostichopus japonicus]|uniref:Putative ubiquitin carboxyl-terminal hydrolase 43 n=1 Tax=Stichopus japonicus TaxID=307972 RepID=A0A2G8JMI7_STIJA|nr:putative ubiquitin carboxyl-terminal hydrolase 43 [Apostichopus japonicus]
MNSHNKSDELLAAESQANYLRHNSSFIHDIFHAQFRSSLKCLNCGQQSSTFEPFLCVSVPIPQRTTRVLTVVVAFITGEPRVIKMAVKGRIKWKSGRVKRRGGQTVQDRCYKGIFDTVLLDQYTGIGNNIDTVVPDRFDTLTCPIARTLTNLLPFRVQSWQAAFPCFGRTLVLCEVYADGFYRCFSDLQPLHDVRDGDNIYAVEIPNNSYSALTSSQVRPYIHGVYHGQPIKEPVTLLVINQVGYGRVGKRIGVCSDQNGNRSILTSQCSRPLYHHIVSSMLQFTASKGEPPHIKAVVEWKEDLTHLFSEGAIDVHIAEHEDYRRLKSTHSQPVCATLQECLDIFTQEEKLAADNAWQCMNCRKLQQCTKKLSLWSLPDISWYISSGSNRCEESTQCFS